jgi:cyclopropane-fatty-acyl-phospholipid synthase
VINTLLERNFIPDPLIRARIRKLLRKRLQDEHRPTAEAQQAHLMQLIATLRTSPIAIETKAANEQHYEVPTAFFRMVMGKHMKYSCCYWDDTTPDLSAAEEKALRITCERAQLRDGMDILELGCGWGSLTMFMAAAFPHARITGVSNSATQKTWIESACKERGLSNVRIITADMNVFDISEKFDRVVSVEMFEHMRNYALLLEKVSRFLKDDGKLFVHIFTHKDITYFFDVVDETDWMSKYFFSGGVMPSDDLLFYFNDHLTVTDHWHWDGTHYGKTAEAWLVNMDAHKQEIMPILAETYGAEHAVKWWVYWRIFFMACAELWNFDHGREWIVSHYVFHKNKQT